MSTIIKSADSPGYILFTKGASEMVLSKCSYYLDGGGNVVSMPKEKIDSLIKNVVEKMASNGLRTICVAARKFIPNDEPNKESNHNYYSQGKLNYLLIFEYLRTINNFYNSLSRTRLGR